MVFERLLLIGVLNMKNIKEYEKEFYFICFSSVFDCSCGTEEKYYGHNNGYCGLGGHWCQYCGSWNNKWHCF